MKTKLWVRVVGFSMASVLLAPLAGLAQHEPRDIYTKEPHTPRGEAAPDPNPPPSPPPPTAQEVYGNLDWCVHNSGVVDCPEEYIGSGQLATCAAWSLVRPDTGGGRACMMDIAIAAAHRDLCSVAFGLSLICQCHNPNARSGIAQFGMVNVCQYLKRYDSFTDVALQAAQQLAPFFGGGN